MWPKDNPESWKSIHEFVAEFPDDHAYWSKWKPIVRDFVSVLEVRGLVELFRIGQSMHTIIFSTLEHHRLGSEPRVTLEFNPTEQMVWIAYSRSPGHLLPADDPLYREPMSQETVPISD